MPVIARYAIVTLVPLAFLFLGATVLGEFAIAALVWLTLVAALLDGLLAPPARGAGVQARWSGRLSVALGVGHLALLPVVLIALAEPGLDVWHKVALFFATASFIGQVSHPNAHELIHRRARGMRLLGGAVYTSVGFGHHVSAHRLVHHRHVGTYDDPNTPLPGEGFWAYLPRAWSESFKAGLSAEEDRLETRGRGPRNLRNPYFIWVGGEAVALVLAAVIAGPVGLLAYLGLIVLAGAQILLSDYVQHYGLQRLELPSGRIEPVGAHHSWNAPRGFSSYLMMNAPAHSEHHLHPDRTYDALDPVTDAPTLPLSLPIMAMLATIPPVWRRMMDRRALRVMEASEARIAAAAGASDDPATPEETAAANPPPQPAAPHIQRIETAHGGRTDLSPLPPVAEEDNALIARIQGMVHSEPPRELADLAAALAAKPGSDQAADHAPGFRDEFPDETPTPEAWDGAVADIEAAATSVDAETAVTAETDLEAQACERGEAVIATAGDVAQDAPPDTGRDRTPAASTGSGDTSLKLRRPVRSGRRAALRDQ
ncbi:alkane 1-monooxygenase [Roseibacterium sp. SDUM158017]|uniref:alkane 1-monooxygenase n=1 Tax=Roseicyclus salinarum TaxID=3036773 RepID=UPI0024156EAF|nr:alkane 1-monooxygenase [Roseibacterium sp. SDUM158017]MDG4649299.1 alkane 1-monooxygenase [Roseibacterium sp. SDUM158017]